MLKLRKGNAGAPVHLKSPYHPAHIPMVNLMHCHRVNRRQFSVKFIGERNAMFFI